MAMSVKESADEVPRDAAGARPIWWRSCIPLTPVSEICCSPTITPRSSAPCSDSKGGSSTTRRATGSRRSTRATRRQEVERIRNDVVMDALSAVAIRLGSMRQGRKSIIFVSEGFTVDAAAADAAPERAESDRSGARRRSAPPAQDSPRQQTNESFARRSSISACARCSATSTATTRRSIRSTHAAWPSFEFDIDAVPGGAAISFQQRPAVRCR